MENGNLDLKSTGMRGVGRKWWIPFTFFKSVFYKTQRSYSYTYSGN